MNPARPESSTYTVVARRYRPQSFTELVGQNHIAQALANAIKQNRVGHAYLFTGARGVGKTSSARIFAKCLNCQQGPTGQPCNQCDICQCVSLGEDIDVLEIDGASNRGIDEIRQLRSNAIVRPSRSRFKIYIIDEVHMLTTQAFNALLKTLEEPPEHIKFIFCTTDPQKIPITVLSRCQRFDFCPVQSSEILTRLQEICQQEGIQADEQALATLARRASGSLRDSQSLLEQLLSFCDTTITSNDVHQLLGTADHGRVSQIAEAIISQDTAGCLNQIYDALQAGVDVGQLASQLLGYFRDLMAVRVGASSESLLTCLESEWELLQSVAEVLGLETILSIVQMLDQCLVRMQSSMHSRTLLEIAVVRCCHLEHLNSLSDLIQQVSNATNPAQPSQPSPEKKNVTHRESKLVSDAEKAAVGNQTVSSLLDSAANFESAPPPTALHSQTLWPIWRNAVQNVGELLGEMLGKVEHLQLDGDRIRVSFSDRQAWEFCRRHDRLSEVTKAVVGLSGRMVSVEMIFDHESQRRVPVKTPQMTRAQTLRMLSQHELVQGAIELFDAEVIGFYDRRTNPG